MNIFFISNQLGLVKFLWNNPMLITMEVVDAQYNP